MEQRYSGLTWHFDVLPLKTQKALEYFSGQNWMKASEWYLADGTAMALQVGHRSSLDLDFFLPANEFNMPALLAKLEGEGWESDIVKENTLYGKKFGAKVSFIAYPYFKRQSDPLWHGDVRIIEVHDIALMKVIAMSQRGRKRDFIDLYWYAKNVESLENVFLKLDNAYPTVGHNYHHLIKALAYFADAEEEPMPELHFKVSWQEIKKFFSDESVRLTQFFLLQ